MTPHDQAGLLIGAFLLLTLILILLLKWFIVQKRKQDENYKNWEQETNKRIDRSFKKDL